MTISLDDVNRRTMRVVFLPWFKEQAARAGITLPPNWNPSDDELEKLAARFAASMAGWDDETDE